MRYSAHLRTSHRHNALKKRRQSNLVSILAFFSIIVVLALTIGFSHLSVRELALGLGLSLFRTSVAYTISLALAVGLALLITVNAGMEAVLLPIFDVLQSFPSFALFPVLVRALESAPEVVIISVLVVTMVWPLVFSIIGGIKNRREEVEEAATIFGARGWKRLVYFTLPELLPSIVTGSIVSWGEAWEFIIGAELLVSVHHGIGHYLGLLGASNQNGSLAFGIVILMLYLFIINRLIWLPLLHRATQYQAEV